MGLLTVWMNSPEVPTHKPGKHTNTDKHVVSGPGLLRMCLISFEKKMTYFNYSKYILISQKALFAHFRITNLVWGNGDVLCWWFSRACALLCCCPHEFNMSELSAEQQDRLLPVKRRCVGSDGEDDTETSGEWQQTTEQPKVCFCPSIRNYLHVQSVFERITCLYFLSLYWVRKELCL